MDFPAPVSPTMATVVLEDVDARLVGEGHVAELYVADDGLPVLALGMEGVAVLFAHGLAVAHIGFGVEQTGDALDVRLERYEHRKVLGKYLHRLEDAHGVGDEGRERAQAQHPVKAHVSALIEHDGHGQRRAEEHQRDVYGAELFGLYAGIARLTGEVFKFLVVRALDDQGLGGLGAHDALVEGARDAGAELAHAAVPVQDAVLEIRRQQRHDGHHEYDHDGELPVEQQHRYEHEDEVAQRPEHIREVPGEHARDAVRVVHHAADEVADGRDVVEGEGELLQMCEEPAPEVAAEVHLDAHRDVAEAHDRERLHQNRGKVGDGEGPEAAQRAGLDEVRHGVALEERKRSVHQRGKEVQDYQQHKGSAAGPQVGPEALPYLDVKGFGVFLLVICRHEPRPLPL